LLKGISGYSGKKRKDMKRGNAWLVGELFKHAGRGT